MRLIDAETLDYKEIAETLETIAITGRTDVESLIKEWIQKEPTAYKLDKVVEQFQAEIKECESYLKLKYFMSWKTQNCWEFKRKVTEHLLEIVKGGGIDEDNLH